MSSYPSIQKVRYSCSVFDFLDAVVSFHSLSHIFLVERSGSSYTSSLDELGIIHPRVARSSHHRNPFHHDSISSSLMSSTVSNRMPSIILNDRTEGDARDTAAHMLMISNPCGSNQRNDQGMQQVGCLFVGFHLLTFCLIDNF
jgi:hypothetical protein